jgi:hypothetical protein
MLREPSNNNGDEDNNWKDALLLGIDKYAILVNKNWNNFMINIANIIIKQVNKFLLYYILYYQKQLYTNYKL